MIKGMEENIVKYTETPRVNTSDGRKDKAHAEAHQYTTAKIDGNLAESPRYEITSHYNINPLHVKHLDTPEGYKRRIRAFTILEHKQDDKKKFYADGHTAHCELLNLILDSFYEEIGSKSKGDFPDDFLTNWNIEKGFMDPYSNGFKSFEKIRNDLIDKSGLTEDEKEKLRKGKSNKELPDWIKAK